MPSTYTTIASQADTPTAGPDHTYFEQIATNFSAIRHYAGARIYGTSTAQNPFASGATTVLNLGSVDYDDASFTGTANRITIPTAGTYIVCGFAEFLGLAGATGCNIQVAVRRNGTTNIAYALALRAAGGGMDVSMNAAMPYVLAATDYLEIIVTPSGTFNAAVLPQVTITNAYPSLSVVRLHA